MNLTKRSERTGWVMRTGILAVCVTIGVATCASAMALRMDVGAEKSAAKDQARSTMPVLISSKPPDYPAVSKESRINGICVLAFTVDEEGMPKEVHIVKSLRPEYDQKAIEAVQQYCFKPALSDGQPVAKQIRVEVSFKSF